MTTCGLHFRKRIMGAKLSGDSMFRLACISVIIALTGCTEDVRFGISNRSPIADIQSPDSETALLFQGITETFRGHIQDPDGRPETLRATWLIGREEVCPESAPTSNGEVFCDIALDAGTTEIRLAVVDTGGLSGFSIKTFWARPSAEPNAEITSLDVTSQYYADQAITFEGLVSDVEDDPDQLVTWWSSNVDGDLTAVEATPSGNGRVSGVGYLTEGDHQIRLSVQDRAGNVSFDTTVLRVGPANRPPECHGITSPIDGGVAGAGTTVIFLANVSDPDVPGNFLDVRWESDKMGPIGTSRPSSDGQVRFHFNGLTVDTHLITLEAEDSFGQTCTSVSVLIVDSPPVIELTSPQSNRVYEAGQPISFTATAVDNEDVNNTLNIQWDDDVDGIISTTRPSLVGELNFPRSDISVGQHLITLTVTDSSGLDSQVQIPYSVNALPPGPGVEITPSDPTTLDTLTAVLSFASVDPDGDAVDYRVQWYRDNVLMFGLTDWTIPSSGTLRDEMWSVEVTPFDPYGDGPMTSITTTIVNSPPILTTVSLAGSPFFETSDIVCTPGASSDADLDTVSFDYSWLVNNSPIPASTNSIDGSRFDRDDTVQCAITPKDGLISGTPTPSPIATVLNSPPVVANAVLLPENPETTTLLTCPVDFLDDDGDFSQSVTTWRLGSTVLGTGSSYSGALNVGDVVTCTVVASDGTSAGNSVSANRTIATSAPTISGIHVDPETATVTTTLTCSYSGFNDPQSDGDQSTIVWSIDGTPVGTGTTLSSGYSKDDTVVCTVTPSDGSNQGPPVAQSITIANSPPTQPSVELSPDFPLAGLDDVVCTIPIRATDADSDTLSYQFDWTVNGQDFFGATDEAEQSTFSRLDFTGQENLVCTVTPLDSDGLGPAATASLTTLSSIEPKLAVGASHSCSLNRRGEAVCWGLNTEGRLSVPPELFLDLDGSLGYTCGIVEDTTLRCWGLGTAVALAPPPGQFVHISAGTTAACAVPTAGGGIDCWGSDAYGQISGAPTTSGFIDIAVGDRHVCAIRSSGSLVCWGGNSFDQTIAPPGNFTHLAAGSLHSCATTLAGEVSCWGHNGNGKSTPPTAPNGRAFVNIGAGTRHSCGVLDNGEMLCWGYNLDGRATPQLTDGAGDPILYDATDLWIHTCAIDDTGKAYCWGNDDDGQSSPP